MERTGNLGIVAGYTYTYTVAHILDDVITNVGKRREERRTTTLRFGRIIVRRRSGCHRSRWAWAPPPPGFTRTAYRADRKNPAYTRFDTRGSFYIDEHWQLVAKAQNLTNESYLSCATSAIMAKSSVSLVL
ncbi:MAG: hypothetical protein ACLGJE_09350 [Gammaproteobacteria bacterium]